MKVKCLVVDDEPLAIQLMKNHLANLDSFEVVACCSNAVKALQVLRSTQVDLVFLDIKMPKISGLEFLSALKNPPAVIITTAYREYALDGYELDLVDYLLKPITFDRFFKAIERYLRKSVVVSQAAQITGRQFLHIRAGGKIHRLAVEQIIYIESVKDYLVFHLADQKIKAKYRIGDLETEIHGNSFLRIHRSFLINTSKINSYTSTDVQIQGGEIPIGASYKEYVFKMLESSRLNK